MTRRLAVLVGILAISSTLTGAYWLWPTSSIHLSAALRRDVRRLTVIRVEPVGDDSVRALTPPGDHTIGITDQPMHDEDHWWLYGKARLSGRTSLVSTGHLWLDDHEGDTHQWLLCERLGKVGVHEFGHSVGFTHCEDPRCVMRFATELWMLDQTRAGFCGGCVNNWLVWHGSSRAR